MERSSEQIPGAVSHEMSGFAVLAPVRSARCVFAPLGAVVPERQVRDDLSPPSSTACLQLVDPVTPMAGLERKHVLKARPAIRARRPPYGSARDEALSPHSSGAFPRASACDAERRDSAASPYALSSSRPSRLTTAGATSSGSRIPPRLNLEGDLVEIVVTQPPYERCENSVVTRRRDSKTNRHRGNSRR